MRRVASKNVILIFKNDFRSDRPLEVYLKESFRNNFLTFKNDFLIFRSNFFFGSEIC